MLKIAIIGPEPSLKLIRDVLGRRQFDSAFDYISYQHLGDIIEIYQTIAGRVDGIIFSGEMGQEYFRKHVAGSALKYRSFSIDRAEFYSNIIHYMASRQKTSLARVYVDFISETNDYLGLNDFLTAENMPQSLTQFSYDETMYESACRQIESLWQAGKIDMVFSRMSHNFERLTALNVPLLYVYPTRNEILKVAKELNDEITIDQAENRLLAVVGIELGEADDYRDKEYSEATMHKVLVDFRAVSGMDFNILKIANGFEITCSRAEIGSSDNDYDFPLFQAIRKNYTDDFQLGIGVGRSIEEGRLHAQQALRESAWFAPRSGFLVDRYEKTHGPIASNHCIEQIDENASVQTLAKKLGISLPNLKRILSLAKTSTLVTSADIEEKLNITNRSASRILGKLLNEGLLLLSAEDSGGHSVGRPLKKYRVASKHLERMLEGSAGKQR